MIESGLYFLKCKMQWGVRYICFFRTETVTGSKNFLIVSLFLICTNTLEFIYYHMYFIVSCLLSITRYDKKASGRNQDAF